MKILCVRNRKKEKPIKYVRRICVETGQTLPFPDWEEIVKLPVNRGEKRKGIFLINKVVVSCGGEMLVLQLLDTASGFGVSQCWAPTTALGAGAGSGWQRHGLGAAV